MRPISSKEQAGGIYSTKILARSWLTERVFEIELSRPSTFHFLAGQRIRLLHGAIGRDYSLITAPYDPTLALCLKKIEGGEYSPILASAEPGTSLSFIGPLGYFTYRPAERPAVFVATGTGIAPFLSMVRTGIVDFTLLHGVHQANSLYYQDIFRRAARLYIPCLGADTGEASSGDNIFRGRVSHYLAEHLPPNVYDFYLCGRQEMIRDVTLLVDERFPGSLIYTEAFY
ncbi:MAG: FAD-binding oxidoreductase [Deltaproteobacteria bacterium]|jgi:benzoate/toluate 1,2-dioxygenase reductase subunit